jgi:ABC-2 type transport system permease protein
LGFAKRQASASVLTPAAPTVLRALRKYLNIFRVSLIERMAYRGDFLLGTVLRFLPMLTTILLWHAVYGADTEREIGQGGTTYNFRAMIAYLLLVHVSRMFSSMPGLAVGVARDIREGTLKKYLVQPLDMIGYLVAYRAAHKVAYIVTSALPYALLFFLCRGFFDGFPDPLTFAAYLTTLLLGFVLGFFFEAAIGMIGFWFLEVTSFLYVINTLNFFVSGHMFPLDLLPAGLAHALKLLPFQYLAYFPAAVFLGKIHGAELVYGLLIEVAWAAGLIVLARLLYRRGLRHYSAYGG